MVATFQRTCRAMNKLRRCAPRRRVATFERTYSQARSQDFLRGGGGGATEAKVDQTIETVFTDCLSRLSFIVAIQRNCNR